MKVTSTILNALIVATLMVVGTQAEGVRGVKKNDERDLQSACVYVTGADGVRRTVNPCPTQAPAPAPQVATGGGGGNNKNNKNNKNKNKNSGGSVVSSAQSAPAPGSPVGSTYPAPGSGGGGATITITSSSGSTTGTAGSAPASTPGSVISSAQESPLTGTSNSATVTVNSGGNSGGTTGTTTGGSTPASPSDGFTTDQLGAPIIPPQTQGLGNVPNILQLAQSAPSLSYFPRMVFAAGLTNTLQGAGPFTVFVPRNAAFPQGVELLMLQTDPNLRNILTYHVVPGMILSSDLTNGMTATSVQGGTLTVGINNGAVTINDANVLLPDLVGSNGVIHIIDKILVPPGVALSQTVGSGLTPVEDPSMNMNTPANPSPTTPVATPSTGSSSTTGTSNGVQTAGAVCPDLKYECLVSGSATNAAGVLVCRGGQTTCTMANSRYMMGDTCGCCIGDVSPWCLGSYSHSTSVNRSP